MRILVRQSFKTHGGASETRDMELHADVLTLGRGQDQWLNLQGQAVALHHARVVQKGRQLSMTAVAGATFVHNGSETKTAVLAVGDVITIGAYTLKVIAPPAGFDGALAVSGEPPRDDSIQLLEDRYDAGRSARGSRRLLAWLMLLLVLVFGAGLPLADNLVPAAHDWMKQAGYPFSRFWSPGNLSAAHHNSKAVFDCHACHETPFTPVTNEKCADCHKFTGNHVHPDNAGFHAAERMNCSGCHSEHKGNDKLVSVDQRQCVDCHADIKKVDASSTLGNVENFQKVHPSFKVSVPVLGDDGQWQSHRVSLDALKSESSNLKFNHKLHLKPEGISGPEGIKTMECADCHRLDESGWFMKPVTMEKTCRSCHSLSFDEDAPERQVPHGDPAKVATALKEYYLGKYLSPAPAATEAMAGGRHGRPGHERESRVECKGPAAECARQMAQRSMEELFERTACFTCHQIDKTGGDGAVPYTVKPVKLVEHWMSGARFSHANHMTENCDRCHKATTSEQAENVLIPDIDNCRECHGGVGAWDKRGSTCVSCHGFHFDDRGYMGRPAILEGRSIPHEAVSGDSNGKPQAVAAPRG